MRAALLLCVTTLLLAGCQFGSDEGNAEFIREADSICSRYERQIALIPQPQTFLRDFAIYMRRVVEIARRQNRELLALDAPEDDAADFRRMVGLLDEQLDMWEEAGQAAFRGDEAAAQQRFQQSAGPGGEAQRLAEAIGFFSCARPEG